jgi:acetylornithine aminotransferase/acetylornithine/N-succinyldiaminopimelate aminotransferase
MTVAKALGNGMPIGVMLTTEKLASALVPGTHASTFGGNPVACAAAVATLKVMLADGFLEEVQAKGDYFRARLAEVQQKHPGLCSHVRGMGLLKGLVMTEPGCERGADIVNAMYDEGILINFAGNCALRFAPPLIVDRTEIDRAIGILDQVLGSQKV